MPKGDNSREYLGADNRSKRAGFCDPLKESKLAAERAYAHALGSGLAREAAIFKHAAEQLIEKENPAWFAAIGQMQHIPVTIEEFIHGDDFLKGAEFELWPELEKDLIEACPDIWTGEDPINEYLQGGATGTGKTFSGTGCVLFHTYQMCCFRQPQRLFGLNPRTALVTLLASVSPTITKRVIYEPLRQTFEAIPFNRRWVQWDDRKESSLELVNNVQIVPVNASLQALVGQAVHSVLFDEVNFMAIVENSKTVPGPNGMGGKFDQAETIYYNTSRRRKRSFKPSAPGIGCLCVSSSTRYKDDFLDRRIAEVEKFEEKGILVKRHRQYEVQPQYAGGKYETFKLLVGNDDYQTRVLTEEDAPGVSYPENAMIIDVPMDYRVEFMKDPDAALRDVVGIATNAITPFIRRRQKITDAWMRGASQSNLLPIVEKSSVDLGQDGMPVWVEENMPSLSLRRRPHFVHIDGSKNNDPTGVGIVRFDGVVYQPTKDGSSMEMLPKFTVVGAIQIVPSVVHEIDMAEVRGWIMQLNTLFGYNLTSISMDGYNSNESLIAFRKMGIGAELISVTTEASEEFRDILYQDRIDFVDDCEVLRVELAQLEYYPEKDIVDHPPRGTKDVADGVQGAVKNALEHRIVWGSIDVVDATPDEEDPMTVQNRRREMPRPREVQRPEPRRPD